MKKALIFKTRILQISDEEFPVASRLFWADVPDNTTTEDAYVDGNVVKYSQSFDDILTNAISSIEGIRDLKKALPILTQGHTVDTGDLDAGIMATKINAREMAVKDVVSITFAGGLGYVTTEKNHHMKTGGSATMAGADQTEFNVNETVDVTGKKTFTYPVAGSPADATGTLTFLPTTMRFIPTDNQVTFVDDATYKEIYLDVEEYVDECQIVGREKKNAALDCIDTEEIQQIIDAIQDGWPLTGLE